MPWRLALQLVVQCSHSSSTHLLQGILNGIESDNKHLVCSTRITYAVEIFDVTNPASIQHVSQIWRMKSDV